jgi:hypothetical protein
MMPYCIRINPSVSGLVFCLLVCLYLAGAVLPAGGCNGLNASSDWTQIFSRAKTRSTDRGHTCTPE